MTDSQKILSDFAVYDARPAYVDTIADGFALAFIFVMGYLLYLGLGSMIGFG